MTNVDDLASLIHLHRDEDHAKIRSLLEGLRPADIAEVLNAVPSLGEAAEVLTLLPVARSIEVCDQPTLNRRTALLEQVDPELGAKLLEGVAADERTAIVRNMSAHGRRLLIPLLSGEARHELERQLQYPEGTAGDLMTTEFVRLAPTVTAGQALAHIREVAKDRESIYSCYVVEPGSERLLGALSLRDLVMADPDKPVSSVMRLHPVTVAARDPQKEVVQKISKYNLLAVPVLETDGRVVGFVTVDDVIDAAVHEQTRTVLQMGAVEAGALDDPYMTTPWPTLVKKRATWLVVLFLGEMLTATAMASFEAEIAQAVVLALFVPLIISSGGNSGSQATSLLIRALALNEVRLPQWPKVLGREFVSGLALGGILGGIGLFRICVWQWLGWHDYGEHWFLVASTVGLSLVGIVLWGSVAGAMLPFVLKRLGLDPATSSAPFVATLVDVTGLIIYFSVAHVVLRGTLL
ncbi:MAG: magnesium transporter [Planctomycetota bacterium]|nr:magnesium transporter [Planctomycetota bacterium]